MTETTVPEQKGETSFWSPWMAFFFGVPFAAINWWRMGNKRKATLFVIVAVMIGILDDWLNPPYKFFNPAYGDFDLLMLTIRAVIGIGFCVVLASSVYTDIEQFNKTDQVVTHVKWTLIPAIYLILISISLLFNTVMYYMPAINNRCPAPSFRDLVYDNDIAGRTGIDTILLNLNDFGCKNFGMLESFKSVNTYVGAIDERYYKVSGKIQPGLFFHLTERIYLYEDEITKPVFDGLVGVPSESDYELLPIIMPENISEITLSKSICHKNDTFRDCSQYTWPQEEFMWKCGYGEIMLLVLMIW